MDYPELNFLIGSGLILANALSTGFIFLLARANLSPFLWRTLLTIHILTLLLSFYIAYLFYQFMTPAFNLRLLLVLIVTGMVVAVLAVFLSRLSFSPVMRSIFLAGLLLGDLTGFILSYLLYRSLVAQP